MLDVQKCREILGAGEEASDEEIEEYEKRLRAIAELFIEEESKNL